MAVTKVSGQFVGNVRSGGSATSASLTLTLTNTVTSGNGMILGFGWSVTAGTGSLTSIVDDKGNDFVPHITALSPNPDPFSGGAGGMSYLLNVTNAPKTVTITVGSTVAAGIAIGGGLYEITGAGSLDVATTGAVTANPLNATFTCAQGGEFGVITSFCSTSNGTFTQNNGATQDFTEAAIGTFYFSNTFGSGSQSFNATGGATYHNAWVVLTFQPPAPGGIPLPWQNLGAQGVMVAM